MDYKLLYFVSFKEDSEIEGRFFFASNDYPVYEKDEKRVILRAENGEFCFSNELMNKAVVEWELVVKDKQADEEPILTNQSKEILYAISVLQKEIDNIDNILINGHLLEDGTQKLEDERKYLQSGIYALMHSSNK